MGVCVCVYVCCTLSAQHENRVLVKWLQRAGLWFSRFNLCCNNSFGFENLWHFQAIVHFIDITEQRAVFFFNWTTSYGVRTKIKNKNTKTHTQTIKNNNKPRKLTQITISNFELLCISLCSTFSITKPTIVVPVDDMIDTIYNISKHLMVRHITFKTI